MWRRCTRVRSKILSPGAHSSAAAMVIVAVANPTRRVSRGVCMVPVKTPIVGEGLLARRLLVERRLNIVRALTGPKFDHAHIRQAVRHERILPRNRLDFLAILADREDDAAVARNLAAGHEEM